MPKKARPHPKPQRQRTFIREWRKANDLTLVQLAERLLLLKEIEISDGQLSRIERGEQPYSQDLLEAIAEVLKTTPASLIMRTPDRQVWTLEETLSPAEQKQVQAFIEAIRRTGTDG